MKTFLYIFLFLFAIVAMPTVARPDDDDETEETVDSTTIQKSILQMPNAFSPNDDGINDYYQAKTNHQNIVEFKGMIFNRWGQCLYTWTDWTNEKSGWNGTYRGKPVKDGVYFVRVKAKGGDGQEFDIKKDVNLLRKKNEVTGANEQ